MEILLLGNIGQLGWELERALAPLARVHAFDYPAIDLSQPLSIRSIVQDIRPDLIINATAYTAVDRAETEPEIAMEINGTAPGVLAEEAKRINAALIHYSTDYVFDGKKGSPYLEEDMPNPLGVYGQTKWMGEQAIQQVGGSYLILRTAWVYSLRRDSFVTKVLQWSRQHRTLRLVTDQVSNPTWARMLAEITVQMLVVASRNPVGWLDERCGLYHVAGDGYASRLEWGTAILKADPKPQEQITDLIESALTVEFPTPAHRPLFSALSCDHFAETFGLRLPPWQDALALAMDTR